MPAPLMSEREFIELYNALGPGALAKKTNQSVINVCKRAQRLRKKGYQLEGPRGGAVNGRHADWPVIPSPKASDIEFNIRDGFGIVASDLHLWPNEHTLMLKALRWACREFKPEFLILNGDVMDFPSISRHDPIGWETNPKPQEEIEFAQEVCHELALACKRGARKIWTLGNHDKRFETRLARLAPEYAKIHGVHLKDHFPAWEPAWSAHINPAQGVFSCLVKHRFRGGIHAVHNNLLWAGNHIVTGHLHSAQVRALTYHAERTIWGMDSGCVAEPLARAFRHYTEEGPKNWRSAFGILRWQEGKMMQPQLVLKWDAKRVQIGTELVTP